MATRRDSHGELVFRINPEITNFPDGHKGEIVSRKEILAALMQHGREYVLTGPQCSIEALKDHIGIRQNIVKWAKVAQGRWKFPEKWVIQPDGTLVLESLPAKFNPAFWGAPEDAFIPKGVSPHEAVQDAFTGAFEYSLGCRSATKLCIMQGIFDYCRAVKKDIRMAEYLDSLADGEPVGHVGGSHALPPQSLDHRNYLVRQFNVPPDNMIPGDWIYIKNTDTKSAQRTGYEGINTIYEGGDTFADYFYDDPNAVHGSPYYTGGAKDAGGLSRRLQEAYNWRFGILEDFENDPGRAFLTKPQIDGLMKDPSQGGLLMNSRDSWADISLPEPK